MVRPVVAGPTPGSIRGLLDPYLENQTRIINAAMSRSRELALEAFLKEPMISRLAVKDAKNLFDMMFNGTAKYLKEYI